MNLNNIFKLNKVSFKHLSIIADKIIAVKNDRFMLVNINKLSIINAKNIKVFLNILKIKIIAKANIIISAKISIINSPKH
ncbi:hypothetical protein [Faecalimicrobium sp. JNUCC 81]